MQRFNNILCVVETEADSRSVLERAVALAKTNQAGLTVVKVIENFSSGIPLPQAAADMQSVMQKHQLQNLESLVDRDRERVEIRTKLLQGAGFLEIIREVLRNKYDLVIKVAETQGWLDRLFGGDDMHLLRKCPCPTWIIKPTQEKSHQIILAAVDVDSQHEQNELKIRQALNRQVLQMASSLALADSAELHIVQVWHAPGESMMSGSLMRTPEQEVAAYVGRVKQQYERNLTTLMEEVAGKLGQETFDYLKPQTHFVKGFARKEIPLLAKKLGTDLVVMGTVGRTGVPGFIIGNTAEMILSQIECSVLAVKPPGFATPVTLEG
jgi:nucleotide-binding universal stress UspA family protein